MTPEEALQEALGESVQFFSNPKFVKDGDRQVLCALHPFAFTIGLVVDIDSVGYSRRYCFPNRSDAKAALDEFEDAALHASGPWIKCKGRYQGQPIDLRNPELEVDYDR